MASMSGGESHAEIEFSSMKQPPLIKQLKGILSEYPDGGQILKELIQNAEDAEASEVKILFNNRRINDSIDAETPVYNKFFKGPSLCIYNDAVFKDKDWDGIRMIYSSVKEDDPLTVGRFGLGFKSVFHITDYPCVISGNKMLLIDPQQPADKVNAMINITDIDKLGDKGLHAGSFWTAFNGMFGFNRDCAQNAYFNGTIFWFPLREKKSEISETLYYEAKVLDLLDVFEKEASSILLFLKNLECISVSTIGLDEVFKELAKAEIDDNTGKLKQSRSKFKEKIKLLACDYKGEDVTVDLQMTIKTTVDGICESARWQIVNYFIGNSASTDFKKLIQDQDLGYSPYVGVASPLSKPDDEFEGHVFCFLPLPHEGSKLTGLPVHVNGFFALSQNRHHLKWETDEQRGKRIDDKNILWNKCLIKEALPKAYSRLVQSIIETATCSGNRDDLVAAVYRCLPLSHKVQNRWKILESELYKRIKKLRILYSKHKKTWVTIADASFASFDQLPENYKHVHKAVIRCLYLTGKMHIDMPLDVFLNLQKHFASIKDLTPESLAKLLHHNAGYKNLSESDKLDVLLYLCSDGRYYQKIEGLELLPLANGGWKTFKSQSDVIYIGTDEEVDILVGQEKVFVKKYTSPGSMLSHYIEEICTNGIFQIKKLTAVEFGHFLESTVTDNLGTSPCITDRSKLQIKWLEKTWKYCIDKNYLAYLKHVHIVPLLTKGSWIAPESVDLLPFSEMVLIKSFENEKLPEGLCNCFENMGVRVLESLPDWIPRDKTKPYFYWPSQKSILSLLTKIGSRECINQHIELFNSRCQWEDKTVFTTCFAKLHHGLTEEGMQFLKKAEIFKAVNSISDIGTDIAVDEINCYINEKLHFPDDVCLTKRCIKSSHSYERLLETLGASKLELEDLVVAKLTFFQKPSSTIEIPKFMDYFISNFHLFQTNDDVIELASKIQFLRAGTQRFKASDLYDPSDQNLQDLLFEEALLPETKKKLSDEKVRILRFLGLKGYKDITADVILKVAKTLDTWSREKTCGEQSFRKASVLMNILQTQHTLLEAKCLNGFTLANSLENLSCIPVQVKRVPAYPECVKWNPEHKILCTPLEANESRNSHLIGGIKPVVVCTSSKMNSLFKWQSAPSIQDVLSQLKIVCESYSVHSRLEILPLIKSIYQHLSSRNREVWQNKISFTNEKIVWTGYDFATASKVIVAHESNDLDLYPYFCFVPTEFQTMQQLYTSFGCRLRQDIDVLLDTLGQIKEVHIVIQDEETVRRDRSIVCKILDKIGSNFEQYLGSCKESDILMMVYDSDPSRLHLLPLPECTYDDDPSFYFENDENVNLVHELISPNTVESLGVKSISRKALMDAEELGIEEWGQQEPLTTRLHALLRDGYTDGLSVPKELIQNADDAGASVVKFLYDERQNADMKQRVFSKGMRHFQGPALWIYNNAQFTSDDMKNITKLNAATKQTDVKKIGKFGLGFCSVYNLTDLPSFLSGSELVFFDPHEKHLGNMLQSKGTGLKYRLPNKTLVARHIDQFKPYSGIFGCNIEQNDFKEYKGSLFRLPLRTEQQAKESHISSLSYTHDEMIKLLHMLLKTAGNLLLFTQNVHEIELHHLPGNAKSALDQKLIYSIKRTSFKWDVGLSTHTNVNVLARMPELLKSKQEFNEIHKLSIKQNTTNHAQNLFNEIDISCNNIESKWMTSWATGMDKSSQMYEQLSTEGAVPLSAVAVPCSESNVFTSQGLNALPCGFYNEGHIFCFLPLPLKTKLQIHINGCFSVTSDRRQLASITEDDKSSSRSAWNVALMEDALVIAFLRLLQSFAKEELNMNADYKYYDLWPDKCATIVQPFKEGFYRAIIKMNVRVFKGNQKWISFKDTVFLDPNLHESDIGALAFEVLSHFPPRQNKSLIAMPRHILENIKQSNKKHEQYIQSNQVFDEEFFLSFLETLTSDFWVNRISERNKVIYVALKCRSTNVKKKMRTIKCIPSEPNSTLARPCDLIHPTSFSALLFSDNEEIFPVKIKEFRKENSLAKLVDLGMNSAFLSDSLLIGRCHTVLTLAKKCCNCARDRFENLMRYFAQEEVLKELEKNERCIDAISDLFMFPVMAKPTGWTFSWKADSEPADLMVFSPTVSCKRHAGSSNSLLFGKSKYLFRQSSADLAGIVCAILDEGYIFSLKETRKNNEKLLQLFGIKCPKTMPLSILSNQMHAISEEYVDAEEQFEDVARIHDKIFRHFEMKIKEPETENVSKQSIDVIKNCRFVLIGKNLLKANNVAFNIKDEVKPYLYRLPEIDKINKSFVYSYLGVQQYFSIDRIVNVMTSMSQVGEQIVNVETYNSLLINLDESMQHFEMCYDDLTKFHNKILAPDTNCTLWPTNQLVIENENYTSTSSMKILHASVLPAVAKKLGAKVKQLRCYQDIKIGISFGQREELVTRIKGLLKAYPCDSSIMKELLQNADDAGATEIHFIKDYRQHSTEKLFQSSCGILQGPSLCVYNNSYFTKNDIEGIHNLGQGSKSDDPTKTGQYGVGFNAVYHLTDTPSFITKGPFDEDQGLMIVFDPLCRHVPQATSLEPGMMCKLSDLEPNFSDHLLGYLVSELINDGNGTVFRLPLRSLSSEISDEIISVSKMDDILKSFELEMFESVLFLKNINRIKISNISTNEMVEEYSVEVQLSEKSEKDRQTFQREVSNIDKSNRSNREHNLGRDPKEVIYEMNVKDSRNKAKHWVIVQRFGMHGDMDYFEEIKESFRSGDLGLLPAGGVAIHLNDTVLSYIRSDDLKKVTQYLDTCEEQKREQEVAVAIQGRAFCFLPLPVSTGLPVHINGHFALDHEARRDLWKDGYRMKWNTCVLNGVVIPAWISGMCYISDLITPFLKNAKNWHALNTTLLEYHNIFPTGECTSDTWTNVSKQFYIHVHDIHAALFPCVLDNKSDLQISTKNTFVNERFSVLWVPIKAPNKDGYYGVFNTVLASMVYKYNDVRLIVKLLKAFGLKLVETPDKVRLAMCKAGIDNIPTSCPPFVISFLKSFDDQAFQSCEIGPIGCIISETKFITPRNLYIFTDFIMQDEEFCKKMIGLPIELTADGVLRVYSENSPVFISSYKQLLPDCAHMFIHEELLNLLQSSQYLDLPIFKRFKFEDFVRLLPSSMDVDIYASGLSIAFKEQSENETSPSISMEWITLFYNFLGECSISSNIDDKTLLQNASVTDYQKRSIDSDLLQENIKLLDRWSFLPCIGTDNKHMLIPMKDICNILHLSYNDKRNTTGSCLAKFRISTLYSNAFHDCHAKEDIKKSMENIVASLKRPYDLLCCLSHHRSELEASSKLTNEDGVELLSYFGRELSVLIKCSSEHEVVTLLCKLPFYLTMQGTLISLATTKNVLVLPKGMPFSGIQEWANACNIILLQEKEPLSALYDFLGLEKADEDFVYGQKILPQLTAMPSEYWMKHIEYLRDKLGQRFTMTHNQSKIIKELKSIAFIRVDGNMRMANQLYDPSNGTFEYLVNSNECLPKDMSSIEWTAFLTKLGLKTDVTNEMMIMFAKQVESLSLNGYLDSTRKKSEVLLARFVERNGHDWNAATLAQLRTVKFIYPFVVEDTCNEVYPQFSNVRKTICFLDAISSKNSDLCWSSSNLCPKDLFNALDCNIRKQLGVLEKPPVENVLLHCQNIIPSFKSKLKNGNISDRFVKQKMTCIYDWFSSQELNDHLVSRLQGKPFVHLPEEKNIVCVNEVVIELSSSLEIKPFLYKSPSFYGQFYELFQQIGCKRSVMFCHYASILQKIKHQCKENEMSVPERAIVKSAFKGLIQLPLDEDTSVEEVSSVFIPTQQLYLKDSKQVIISNKKTYEHRLKGKINLDLCVELLFLDIQSPSLEEACTKWPNHLRPVLLADVVTEEVCMEDSLHQRITNSKKARKLERFLHSNELVTALCRLIKHQSARKPSQNQFDPERTEVEIAANLRNVTVVEFPALKTVLKYKGIIVEGSERLIEHHIQRENGSQSGPCTFFFNDKSKSENVDIPKILHGIISLLKICTTCLNVDSIIHLTLLIQSFEYPYKLHSILDDLHIQQYGSPQETLPDYFPKPGTYVEEQFIPFLEQGIIPFQDFEFEHVAMELEDDDDGLQNPVYIYVKILREEVKDVDEGHEADNFERIYIVETGNTDIQTEKVPIYRLYRFVRRDTGNDIEVYTGKKQKQQIPIDEECRKIRRKLIQAWKLPEKDRKRIVRRIILEWHPDKNRGNEEYCTKVFQYIQVILSRLENGEPLGDDVDDEMRRGKSQFSQSSSAFYENVFKRARTYARAYYDNFEAYSRSERTGDFTHSNSATVERQDHGEAQRWLRQAKHDFQAALEMFPVASGASSYNWVCYICHQVCEKALKAAHYSRDANNVPEGVFLPRLAITSNMMEQASLLETRLGAHGRLRYPDALSRPRIPSDIYSMDDAEFSIEVARKILEMVEEYI